MNCITLLNEIAALAGFTISGTGQDAINKARCLRRLNQIKADVISRYGGKWQPNYREGWLPLVPLYATGTSAFTINSRTVTGSSTLYTTAMKGYKIKGPDGAYYKISSVSGSTALVLSQPYQGATATINTNIWKDEYRLYPEALSIGGFIDYQLDEAMREVWSRNMKDSYTNPSIVASPDIYTLVGHERLTATYSTGTLSASINTNVWTGVGTSWLANVEPGMALTVGIYTYHVLRVNSDTELETYQMSVLAVAASTYSAIGKNSVVVRFKGPTDQRVVAYWYWAKDYPFLNDYDEDWIAETYPEVLMDGAVRKDYLDKNDVARASLSTQAYENAIKDMKVAMDGAFTGPRTLGYYIPDEARDL